MAAGSKDIKAGGASVELSLKDRLTGKLDRVAARLKSFGSGVAKVGLGVGALGVAILAPLAGTVKMATDVGTELKRMSEQTGESVEKLSLLKAVGEDAGVGFDELGKSLVNLQKGIASGALGADLASIGLSFRDLANKSPTEQMEAIADRLSRLKNEYVKTELAAKFFGDTGVKLKATLDQGGAGIRRLMGDAKALGREMSDEDATAARDFGVELNRLESMAKSAAVQLGSALIGTLKDLMPHVLNAVKAITTFIRENRQIVVTVAAVGAGLLAAGAALLAIGGAATAVGFAFSGLSAAIATIFSPLGAAVAAGVAISAAAYAQAAALAYLFSQTEIGKRVLGELGAYFRALWERVKETWGGITDAIQAGEWQLAAQIAWVRLKAEFYRGVYAIEAIWHKFADGIVDGFNEAMDKVYQAWLDLRERMGEEATGFIVKRPNRDGERVQRDAARKADLDQREAEIRKLLDQAARMKAAANLPKPEANKVGSKARQEMMGIAEIVKGTFSSYALGQSLGVGDKVTDRIARNTEDTAKNTKEIAAAIGKAALAGGFVFT